MRLEKERYIERERQRQRGGLLLWRKPLACTSVVPLCAPAT